MLAASYISYRMGIMTKADRAKHDALVLALDPKIFLPPHDITDEVLDKVMHDNKRGYLPERAGFCPFILNRRIGEMHAPNKHYLEYVPVPLVREAILWVVDTMRKASAAGSLRAVVPSLEKMALSRAPTQESELAELHVIEKGLSELHVRPLSCSADFATHIRNRSRSWRI